MEDSVGSVPSVFSESLEGRFGLICYSPFPALASVHSDS